MKYITLTLTLIISMAFLFSQNKSNGFTSQTNKEFAATIANNDIQLIDVRTPDEFDSGHIPDAYNIDVQSPDFDYRSNKLDKSKPVAVYCRSGARSKIAAKALSKKGYTVYELNNGIMNWDGPVE